MSQHKYVLDLPHDMGLLGCKYVRSPADINLKLGKREIGPQVDT